MFFHVIFFSAKILETLNSLSEKLPSKQTSNNSQQAKDQSQKKQSSIVEENFTSSEIRMAQAIIDNNLDEVENILRETKANKKHKISILLNTISVQSLRAMFTESNNAEGKNFQKTYTKFYLLCRKKYPV